MNRGWICIYFQVFSYGIVNDGQILWVYCLTRKEHENFEIFLSIGIYFEVSRLIHKYFRYYLKNIEIF